MATKYEYVTAASGTVYEYEKRATVYIPELFKESADIAGGPNTNIPIRASGVRCNSDIYWNSPSGI